MQANTWPAESGAVPASALGIVAATLVPGRSMLWGDPGEESWAWVLDPVATERNGGAGGAGTWLRTRLRVRHRYRCRWLHPSIAFNLLIEFADIVMIRRMLLNLKACAEALRTPRRADPWVPVRGLRGITGDSSCAAGAGAPTSLRSR